MRSIASTLLLPLLVACQGASQTDGGTETTTFVPPPVLDTGWPAGDLGNFHIAHHANSGRTEVMAVATTSNPGFGNLAQCAIRGTVCIGGLPNDEEDYVDVDPDQDIERETLITRFLGYEIEFGPYTLEYREDPETKFGFYAADVTDEELAQGWIGVEWEGQWPEYSSKEDLFVSRPIELLSPMAESHIVFTNGQIVPFEWVPTGEGQVSLLVTTRFTLARLYHLEDDGYFELDVDSLLLPNQSEELTFTFTRWNQTTLQRFGHVVDLIATSDASLTAEYYNIGSNEQIFAADGCPEAQGQPALEAGYYWGFLDPMTDDLSPLVAGSPAGKDAFVRLEVQPLESIEIDYNAYDIDPAVYLCSECDDENSCAVGANLSADPNVNEYLNYINISDEVRTVYLGLDADELGDSVYTLAFERQPLLEPEMYDTCEEAQDSYTITAPGSYYASIYAYGDDSNPGTGGCTGTSVGGSDAVTPIEIPGGGSIQINLNMPGADPALYLLTNCQDLISGCAAGADNSIGPTEQLPYTNNSPYPATVYLVVDSKSGMRPYFMTIQ